MTMGEKNYQSPGSIDSQIEPFLEAAVEGALDFSDRMHAAEGAEILACADCWELVDGDILSIRSMDDEELKQALVEDMLSVRYWEVAGKSLDFRPDDLLRHLPPDLHERTRQAYADPFVQSLLDLRQDGQVRIHDHHLQDAMDFAGVWHEGFEPLTDGTVYRAAL